METNLIKSSKNVLANGLMVVFIGIYLAVTPFDYMVGIGYIAHATKLAVLGIMIFFVVDNIISNDAKIKLEISQYKTKKTVISLLLFFIYMCLTTLFSNVDFSKTKEILSIFMQSFIFIFIILNINLEKNDVRRIENIWFLLTGMFSLVMTAYNIFNPDRTKLIIMQGTTDPNFYCATLIGPFLIGVSRLINKNVGKKRMGVVAILINMVFMMMISGSRGSLLAVIIASFVYLFLYYKKQHKILKIFKVLLIMICLVVLLIPFIPDKTIERFSVDGIFGNGGSGRTSIWKSAINYFKESEINKKMLGNGIGTFRYNAGENVFFEELGFSTSNVYSHNIIITILIEGGIIGLILIFLFIKNILTETYSKQNKIAFCAVIGILIAGMFVEMIYQRIFWAIIGYAIIFIKSKDIGEENEKESEHSSTSI